MVLDHNSSQKLARCGLMANCIEGISKKSKIQNHDRIIQILKNSLRAFVLVKRIASGDAELNEAMLYDLHSLFLSHNNIEPNYEEDNLHFELKPLGRLRQAYGYTQHVRDRANTTSIVMYCPNYSIKTELDHFLMQAKQILSNKDPTDPYYDAAWLHASLIRIHPFADGNGRVVRLIASIPLLKANLPPVFVASAQESKSKYYQILMRVDEDGDVAPLAAFLQKETFQAMQTMINYVPSPTSSTPRSKKKSARALMAEKHRLENRLGANTESPVAKESQRQNKMATVAANDEEKKDDVN